jgi:2-keto-4-pentenoate hydratase
MTPMTASSFDPAAVARRLIRAHNGAVALPHTQVLAPNAAIAYAVQDETMHGLGPIGGWKVGAKDPAMQPACAPLPACGLFPTGATLLGPPWRMRGIEVEVAVRLGCDLIPGDGELDAATLANAIECLLPVIEVVETRLADWRVSVPLAQLADLQSHGGLVIGEPSKLSPHELDLRSIDAYLAFDGQPVASTHGANPAGDVWRLLAWLARHCAERGQPLRAGQVITTGSCTGMLFAPEGAHVQAQLDQIGLVDVRF